MPVPAKRVSSSSPIEKPQVADAVDLKPFRRSKKSVRPSPTLPTIAAVVFTSAVEKQLETHLMGNMPRRRHQPLLLGPYPADVH
jgi:hypothetical protein